MRLPRWRRGRQGTGYRKICLWEGRRHDVHILDYPEAVGIPMHVDPLPDRRHLRINLSLLTGGSRVEADSWLFRLGDRLSVFWSDRPHRVVPGYGRRLVVSIGVAV